MHIKALPVTSCLTVIWKPVFQVTLSSVNAVSGGGGFTSLSMWESPHLIHKLFYLQSSEQTQTHLFAVVLVKPCLTAGGFLFPTFLPLY